MDFAVRVAGLMGAAFFCSAICAAGQIMPASDNQSSEQTSLEQKTGEPKPDKQSLWQAARNKPQMAITTAFDAQGKLWRARVEQGRIMLGYSTDLGQSFSPEMVVNAEPETIAAENENRPKLAFGNNNEIYLSWTRSLDQPFSGEVRFARSQNGGITFSTPVTVNDNHDIISHRFDALTVDAQGHIHLAWLDKRDQFAAKSKGENYAGSALYYAVSKDRGETFSNNRKLADHSCECCRVAMDMDRDNVPVIFWRHVFDGNVRDHALMRLGTQPQFTRASFDQWQVQACPHHGGALSIGDDNIYHFVWFNNGTQGRGLFYAQSKDQGKTREPAMAVGNFDRQAVHPFVLALKQAVYLVWKEFDGQQTRVQMLVSSDAGNSWQPVNTIAHTDGASDHPLLVSNQTQVFLSWNTSKQGLIFLPLESGAVP